LSLEEPLTKAFSVAIIVLSVILLISLLLVASTANALPRNIDSSGISLTEKGGVAVFSTQVYIHNPGPLELDDVSAGLAFYAEPSLQLESYSPPYYVGVGQNVSIPLSLSLDASGAAACRLLFYGEDVRVGFLLNTTLGGLIPIYVDSYTNLSFGPLFGQLSVELSETQTSQTQALYTLKYSFTDENQYLTSNATLYVVFGQTANAASIPLLASPNQHVSGSKSFEAKLEPQSNVSVLIATGWGEYLLAQNASNTYGGDVSCG